MKNKFFGFVLFLISFSSFAQNIPVQPNPPRLVNDFADILSPTEEQNLENKLRFFNDSTSTQIVVVSVKSLGGYDKNQFAYEIGQKWGVGQKGKNNGAVILVKPKTIDERGEVSIQSGYGLEATLTDALSKRIIENEMIPEFKQNNYYLGIEKAANSIILVTKGEYKADAKINPKKIKFVTIFIILIIIFILSIVFRKKGGNGKMGGGAAGMFFPPIFFGGSSGSGFGNFSSGSGSFGGFGGGSFGGGGAGGSW